jgi:hypothetical protein
MPRYIDADKLIDKIFPIGLIDDGNYTINAKAVKIAIDKMPTADVVPKSEVEQIFDDIERLMFATKIGTLHGFYYSTDLKYCVTELKNKYTESEDTQ